MISVVIPDLDKGRFGLPSTGAEQPITRSPSSIDGAKPDQQHDPIDGVNVEHVIRQIIIPHVDGHNLRTYDIIQIVLIMFADSA